MKFLVFALVLVLIFALLGWISFSTTDSSATITIDKQEVQEDAQAAARQVREATQKAVTATKDAVRAPDSEEESDHGRDGHKFPVHPTP